ncbi:unnamed protein product [Ilex paraguariensis]|uniref:Uncharacterized protein n=1 Tax=Ilex paraguariensis TaxID=185542 RepID=A0ABC8QZK8_9AQUA
MTQRRQRKRQRKEEIAVVAVHQRLFARPFPDGLPPAKPVPPGFDEIHVEGSKLPSQVQAENAVQPSR